MLLIACGAGGSETTTLTFAVGESPRLVVGAGRGEILVSTGPEGVITVLSEVSEKDNVVLDVSANGDVVTARSTTTFSGNLFGDTAEGSVKFTITVPPQTVIEVGASSGPITVRDVQNGGTVTVGVGTLSLRSVSGDFSGGTGTGDIRITDSRGTFSFTAGVGAIRFDGTLSEGESSDFETGVGEVTVSFPDGTGVDLDATVNTGQLTSELDLTDEITESTTTGSRLAGTLGGGGAELIILVGTGSLEISDKSDEPPPSPIDFATP